MCQDRDHVCSNKNSRSYVKINLLIVFYPPINLISTLHNCSNTILACQYNRGSMPHISIINGDFDSHRLSIFRRWNSNCQGTLGSKLSSIIFLRVRGYHSMIGAAWLLSMSLWNEPLRVVLGKSRYGV